MEGSVTMDSGVILAFAKEEKDKDIDSIQQLFELCRKKKVKLFISAMTISELFAVLSRTGNTKKAVETLVFLEEIGVKIIMMNRKIAERSGLFKTKYGISYGDAVVLATAAETSSVFLTYDRDFFHIKEHQIMKPEEYAAQMK